MCLFSRKNSNLGQESFSGRHSNQYYERVRKIENLSSKYNVKGFNSLLKVFRSVSDSKSDEFKNNLFLGGFVSVAKNLVNDS